jgi:hypothetical protein
VQTISRSRNRPITAACTELVGLDGLGDARMFANYTQWTAAQSELRAAKAKTDVPARAAKAPHEKTRRLTYQEQREWDTMEEWIIAAEEAVAARERGVETAGRGTDHVRLQKCCAELHAAHAHAPSASVEHTGVDHRRFDARMTEQPRRPATCQSTRRAWRASSA